MKILLTGGGTGGHFYPIIAVAEAIRKVTKEQKLIDPTLIYMGPKKYDERALFENGIQYVSCTAGKVRRYFSLLNIFDAIKTAIGILSAIMSVWKIYPDVVFSKGGYVSFPVLVAAKILRIPIIIHESDSHPGRVNLWAGKFARKIAISYKEAADYFPKEKIALTGNPVRRELLEPAHEGAREFLKLENDLPVVFIIGGSQGSERINEAIIGILPELVKKYYVIHQTGKNNIEEITHTAKVILNESLNRDRYKPFAYLNTLAMRMAAGAANIIVSRGGAGQIAEIALWGIPSIIIPIPQEISHDQTSNAFAYAASGGCSVIEEINLTPHVLASEIDRIIEGKDIQKKMKEGAARFAKRDAAEVIAKEVIEIALSHETKTV